MKNVIKSLMIGLFLILVARGMSYGAIIVSQVGDVDGFHPGDPADIPPRSQTLLDAFNVIDHGDIPQELDIWNENIGGKGYSHIYSIPSGQVILSATLTVGVYWERDSSSGSDFLLLDDIVNGIADGSIIPGGDHYAEIKNIRYHPSRFWHDYSFY